MNKRYTLLRVFIMIFLVISFIVRFVFSLWVFDEITYKVIGSFFIGSFYDIGTVSFFAIPYALYLFLTPNNLVGSVLDKVMSYFIYALSILIVLFSFFGEITFWDEFKRRFNFIAVDYLIYTYEVIENINQSYPLPLLIGGMFLILFTILFFTYKKDVFKNTFNAKTTSFKTKGIILVSFIGIAGVFSSFIKNTGAEWSENRYVNELSKAGIYSFFSAFRNNEIEYKDFYSELDETEVREKLQKLLNLPKKVLKEDKLSVRNKVTNLGEEKKPNVIFICVESLSGSFFKQFGNEDQITPTLDSLAQNSFFFSNLYATGTRTIRGMEAITLSIPPTPGRSIVKRPDDTSLYTIGEVFRKKGYVRNFFYGGDGYFDNMNNFFGGNGFNIIDRGRSFLLGDHIKTTRTNIEDNEVTFENAWGACDEDVFNKVIKKARVNSDKKERFFDFIMTTSNHKPYTYPDNKIDIPSGTGRNGAVKYTDYAIKTFFDKIKKEPWFKNTVIVIMADHCASSAGQWELDLRNYHIPAMIVNLPESTPQVVDKLCSQIDVFPTLFGLLNWSYETNFYGKDVRKMNPLEERAFVGNYRKLGYFKKDLKLTVLNDKKEANFYQWNPENNDLLKIEEEGSMKDESITYYQSASDLYKSGGLKINNQ